MGVGDFNGDLDPDLAVANEGENTISILLGGAGGSFSAPTNITVGSAPQTVGVGDFNGDSDPDLAVVNEGSSNVSVLLGGAGASFSAPTNFSVGGLPRAIVIRDYNGDSDLDLAVANEATNNVSILLGATGRDLHRAQQRQRLRKPDRDHVGRVQRRLRPRPGDRQRACHNISALGGATGGTFTGLTNTGVGNLPDDLAVGEFNGDSDGDLAVANQASDNVSVLIGGQRTGVPGPDQPAGRRRPQLGRRGRLQRRRAARTSRSRTSWSTTSRSFSERPSTVIHAPRGASPFRVALVPAYDACPQGSANRTHGPPLEHASCNPPVQSSGFVTIGSPDANSAPVQSLGSLRYGVAPGDVTIEASITDVRNKTGLADYAGELQARVTLRITDKVNGGSLTESGTLGDRTFVFTLPCSPTGGAANVGSTCSVQTGANAVVPGIVASGKRAIWQMSQAEVLDGGPDGDVDTPTGNTVFARQGIFVP